MLFTTKDFIKIAQIFNNTFKMNFNTSVRNAKYIFNKIQSTAVYVIDVVKNLIIIANG